MDGLYSGMSVGFGFLLFCTLLSFIWIIFQNFKNRMLPKNKSINVIDIPDNKIEEESKVNRVEITWPVSFETVNGRINAETKDVSRSGAFIKCNKPLLPCEQFYLTIYTPSKGPVSLTAEVIWSNCKIPEEKVVIRGMCIRFIQNRAGDLALLKSALEEYLELINKAPAQQIAFT